jgi:hypothetical protein
MQANLEIMYLRECYKNHFKRCFWKQCSSCTLIWCYSTWGKMILYLRKKALDLQTCLLGGLWGNQSAVSRW